LVLERNKEIGDAMRTDESKIRNCKFEFKCDADWDELTVAAGQDFEKVRHCGRCSKNVYKTEGSLS